MHFKSKKTLLGLAMMIMVVTLVQVKEHDRKQDLLSTAYECVKAGYGEFYIPSIDIEPATLEMEYGIPYESVESYFGEAAMMSTYPDVFIGIKAKKGHVQNVSDALNSYRVHLIERFQESPAGLAKVHASRVFVYEEFVFFMILGQPSDTIITSEEVAAHEVRAKEAAAIGIEKLNSVFGGQ